jgi:hypothetical protein
MARVNYFIHANAEFANENFTSFSPREIIKEAGETARADRRVYH